MNYNLSRPFYDSACKYPDSLAISADGKDLLYSDALRQVVAVAHWLRLRDTTPRRVGILASRSSEACIGILATAWIGAAYVPVSLDLPNAGILEVLKRSNLDALIADKTGSQLLSPELLAAGPSKVLAYRCHVPADSAASIEDYNELIPSPAITAPEHMDSNQPAYILYTSGSTGTPKGVVVPVGAVEHLLHALDSNYPLDKNDRVAETTAISFDLSVYNMFATWRAAASLHIVPSQRLLSPTKFIRDHRITIWLSVPSIATFMVRMKLLKPGSLPSLRLTLFCGEPLLGKVAAAWQNAAPFSTVVNMYGPTEATVMCTAEDFGPDCSMTKDIVAIGRPFPGTKAAVATQELSWADDGASGELLLSGPQLALHYLDDAEKTQSKFVEIAGERWYKTGDLATRTSDGVLHYLGRIDNQIKIRGYRVELEEIESHLRTITGCESLAAVPWPILDGTVLGVVAFIAGFDGDPADVKNAMKDSLPLYMVPSAIHTLPQLPINNNGKVDRNALAKLAASDEKILD